jgi:ABC-type branched-subunit amino acid transport system substrate-binding protein
MRALAACLLVGALTSCGTTVAVQSQGGALGPAAPGLSTDLQPQAPTGSDLSGAPVGTTSPIGSTGTGTPTAGATQAVSTPTGGQAQRRQSGRGYTATTIRIGFSISSDSAAALGGFGLAADVADQRQLIKTYVDEVNRTGGIAGRKVEPVIYDYSATGDKVVQDQAACTKWTQDDPVFAATGVRAGMTGSGEVLTPCLAKAGVPWLQGVGDRAKWSQYRSTLYSTNAMDITREQRLLVEALAAQRELTSSSKVGVIINDNQGDYSRAVREGTEPALAKLGLKVARKVVIQTAQTESRNAELQMYAAGVTNVLFAAPGGAGAAFFMQAAESQGRTYKYGLGTQDAPGVAVQGLAPVNQLRHARGYGYRPSLDVDEGHQPQQTTGMRHCFDFYRKQGFSTGSLNRAAMAIICDGLDLVRAGVAGQANPTTASFQATVESLGDRLAVAGTFAAQFSPAHHDGAAAYRFLVWDEATKGFAYSGGNRSAP